MVIITTDLDLGTNATYQNIGLNEETDMVNQRNAVQEKTVLIYPAPDLERMYNWDSLEQVLPQGPLVFNHVKLMKDLQLLHLLTAELLPTNDV